jgi:hypothetical protein
MPSNKAKTQIVIHTKINSIKKHLSCMQNELNLTAKEKFLASFINFKDISPSNRVRRAISSKSWRKWKVTLSIRMIFTYNNVLKEYHDGMFKFC